MFSKILVRERKMYISDHLLSQPSDTLHSCSRHGLVAARLTSEQPGSIIPLSKNIYCTVNTFIASVTVDFCGMVCALLVLLPACLTALMPTSSKCSCH